MSIERESDGQQQRAERFRRLTGIEEGTLLRCV